jgi:hypothetical protein
MVGGELAERVGRNEDAQVGELGGVFRWVDTYLVYLSRHRLDALDLGISNEQAKYGTMQVQISTVGTSIKVPSPAKA